MAAGVGSAPAAPEWLQEGSDHSIAAAAPTCGLYLTSKGLAGSVQTCFSLQGAFI